MGRYLITSWFRPLARSLNRTTNGDQPRRFHRIACAESADAVLLVPANAANALPRAKVPPVSFVAHHVAAPLTYAILDGMAVERGFAARQGSTGLIKSTTTGFTALFFATCTLQLVRERMSVVRDMQRGHRLGAQG